MHSKTIRKNDEVIAIIHHNSDWSGDVLITEFREGEVYKEYSIPGALLHAVGVLGFLSTAQSSLERFAGDFAWNILKDGLGITYTV